MFSSKSKEKLNISFKPISIMIKSYQILSVILRIKRGSHKFESKKISVNQNDQNLQQTLLFDAFDIMNVLDEFSKDKSGQYDDKKCELQVFYQGPYGNSDKAGEVAINLSQFIGKGLTRNTVQFPFGSRVVSMDFEISITPPGQAGQVPQQVRPSVNQQPGAAQQVDHSNGHDFQYTITPKLISFSNKIRPYKIQIMFIDDQKRTPSSEYWIIAEGLQTDCSVEFREDVFKNQTKIALVRGQQFYQAKEVFLDLFQSPNENTGYQMLRRIPINLTKYIGQQRTDDFHNIDDLGIFFSFEIELLGPLNAPQVPPPMMPPGPQSQQFLGGPQSQIPNQIGQNQFQQQQQAINPYLSQSAMNQSQQPPIQQQIPMNQSQIPPQMPPPQMIYNPTQYLQQPPQGSMMPPNQNFNQMPPHQQQPMMNPMIPPNQPMVPGQNSEIELLKQQLLELSSKVGELENKTSNLNQEIQKKTEAQDQLKQKIGNMEQEVNQMKNQLKEVEQYQQQQVQLQQQSFQQFQQMQAQLLQSSMRPQMGVGMIPQMNQSLTQPMIPQSQQNYQPQFQMAHGNMGMQQPFGNQQPWNASFQQQKVDPKLNGQQFQSEQQNFNQQQVPQMQGPIVHGQEKQEIVAQVNDQKDLSQVNQQQQNLLDLNIQYQQPLSGQNLLY